MGVNMCKSGLTVLRANAATTSSYVVSSEVPIGIQENVVLLITVTSGAAGDIVAVLPEVSVEQQSTPSKTWLPISVTNGALTATSVGTVPGGAAYADFGFATQQWNNVFYVTPAASGAGQVIRLAPVLNTSGYRTLRVQVRATAGTPSCSVSAVCYY